MATNNKPRSAGASREGEEKIESYDLIIIGIGPAGLTASIYASRYKLPHLTIGRIKGGLMSEAPRICNYPSEEDISGRELTNKMYETALSQGAELLSQEAVQDISRTSAFAPPELARAKARNDPGENELFRIKTDKGNIFFAKKLLIATGTEHKKLNLENEDKFLGRGVSYCATCDGMFFKGKRVAVIGGNDSAITASLYLSRVAEKVYQIYRKDKLRGEPRWVEQLNKDSKIEVIYNTNVTKLEGKNTLEKIYLDNYYQGKKELEVNGLFIEIGSEPKIELLKKLGIDFNENNCIKVKGDQSTNIEGVWAAGDITDASNNFRQIVTACSEGAVAANSISLTAVQQRQKQRRTKKDRNS